ncbi:MULTISPECIES: alpha/beta fold hydrolase [unclassified Tsukamurella]|uniref:esterase/lipase family protein n=1 Tax=unclassified Tsukamurella TaxID=2633480 RepID=UPI0031BB610A
MSPAAGVGADPAGAGRLREDFDFFAGIPYELRGRGGSLPGSNDFDRKPTPEHPVPVVLVHGTGGGRQTNWGAYVPLLANEGFSVFALTYGAVRGARWPLNQIGGMRSIEASAAELGEFIERVLDATGAPQVDIVGHSQGTLVPAFYAKALGGGARIRRYVSLAPLWRGTGGDLARMALTVAGRLGLGERSIPGFAALGEMLPGSSLLQRIWDGGTPYLEGIEYWNISTRYDELVLPYRSGQVPGPPGITVHNIVVQDTCSVDLSDHLAICGSRRVAYMVLNALDDGDRPIPCYPVVPFTGA